MKIVVTGGAGFVGHHIVEALAAHNVWVWDRKGSMSIEIARQTSHELEGVECIIHAAAHADISHNWKGTRAAIWRDNLEATYHLLEIAIQVPSVKSFVFLSTGAVYGSTRWQIAGEERACQATSPYVASKLAGEAFLQAYALKGGWQWHVARLVSCVGYGYHHGHIADFVRMARDFGHIEALDDGHSPKEFIHVKDAASAIAKMATGDIPSGIYNVTSGKLWSWRDTVRVMGSPEHEWQKKKEGWLGDPVGLRLSQESLSPWWRAKYSVESGVEEALEGLGWQISR